MLNLRQVAEAIVAREGGFVNDPDDPGGATNFGVTLGTMKRLGVDLDRNGQVDLRDLRALTKAQAADIYIEHYHKRPGLDRLPEGLQPSCFDMYVHSGANAVRILQRLVTRRGFATAVDGILGPKTLAQVKAACAGSIQLFVDAYGIERRNYYYALGDARSQSRKYVRRKDGGKGGWITRAEEFISPRFHLTEGQHRARVSSWG